MQMTGNFSLTLQPLIGYNIIMIIRNLFLSPKNRKWLAVCIGLGILAFGCDNSQKDLERGPGRKLARPDEITARPNILLLVVDTLRFDATSIADPHCKSTPFLKRLARDAVHFSKTYSTFDYTPPSHFSMLTGFVSGILTDIDRMELALPYQLKKIGYDTFGVAANGNLSQKSMPVLLGFDRYLCLQEQWGKMPAGEHKRLYPELDTRITHYGGRANDFNRKHLFSSAKTIVSKVKEWLLESDKPFFGFVNLIDPHDPYFPDPKRYDQEVAEKNIRPRRFDSDLRFRQLGPPLIDPEVLTDEKLRMELKQRINAVEGRKWSLSDDLAPESLRLYRMRYEAEVRETDQHLKELFTFLKREKRLDDTVIIVTSDHGEAFGEKGYMTHSLSNQGDREATQRVPLLVYFPKSFGIAAREITALCSIADIPPMIYDLLGIDWWPLAGQTAIGNFGKSLVPFFSTSANIQYSSSVQFELPAPGDPAAREKFKKESLKRLRSLGYIN